MQSNKINCALSLSAYSNFSTRQNLLMRHLAQLCTHRSHVIVELTTCQHLLRTSARHWRTFERQTNERQANERQAIRAYMRRRSCVTPHILYDIVERMRMANTLGYQLKNS